ncbi:hypothetical protein GCM10022419_116500 [Nonomuraea rosea]|uniref:MFS transporter n=2 Tax=Nonomuraea rosea TaxID=638574 RepID=A0ABP6ZK48_9ACTN
MRALRDPLTPPRLFADRPRSGAYLNMLLLAAVTLALLFLLGQFLQNARGLGPLAAGLAFLPMPGLLFAFGRVTPRLISRFGTRRLTLTGLPLIAVATAWLTRPSVHDGYVLGALVPLTLFAVGAGLSFLPLTLTVLSGVRARTRESPPACFRPRSRSAARWEWPCSSPCSSPCTAWPLATGA